MEIAPEDIARIRAFIQRERQLLPNQEREIAVQQEVIATLELIAHVSRLTDVEKDDLEMARGLSTRISDGIKLRTRRLAVLEATIEAALE